MILAKHHPNFSPEFPELFPWELLDSHSLRQLALTIFQEIRADFKTTERNNVPGLRLALNLIAEIANC